MFGNEYIYNRLFTAHKKYSAYLVFKRLIKKNNNTYI